MRRDSHGDDRVASLSYFSLQLSWISLPLEYDGPQL